jgi:uncharacterized damage-inducible protein DinB
MPTLRELVDAYEARTGDLRKAVAGMTREQLLARPVPGKWSTLEVVCHLVDFEPIYAERMKRVIALDEPPLLAADETKFAETLRYQDRDLEEELAVLDATRRQMVRILRRLPDEAVNRVGIHNERGPRTLGDLVGGVVEHVKHHMPFIVEKRRALGLST